MERGPSRGPETGTVGQLPRRGAHRARRVAEAAHERAARSRADPRDGREHEPRGAVVESSHPRRTRERGTGHARTSGAIDRVARGTTGRVGRRSAPVRRDDVGVRVERGAIAAADDVERVRGAQLGLGQERAPDDRRGRVRRRVAQELRARRRGRRRGPPSAAPAAGAAPCRSPSPRGGRLQPGPRRRSRRIGDGTRGRRPRSGSSAPSRRGARRSRPRRAARRRRRPGSRSCPRRGWSRARRARDARCRSRGNSRSRRGVGARGSTPRCPTRRRRISRAASGGPRGSRAASARRASRPSANRSGVRPACGRGPRRRSTTSAVR